MPWPPRPLLLLAAMGFCTTVLGWDPPLGIPVGSIVQFGSIGILCLMGAIFFKQNDVREPRRAVLSVPRAASRRSLLTLVLPFLV